MADTIAWDDGSGDVIHLTTSLPETGSKIIAISSDPNRGAARSKILTFRTLNGTPQRTVQITINQPAGEPTPEHACITFRSTGTNTISLSKHGSVGTPTLYYSLDGTTWTQWDLSAISISAGHPLFIYGNNSTFSTSTSNYLQFVIGGTGNVTCSGNIMTLVDGAGTTKTIPAQYFFMNLFRDCTKLTAGPQLPATTLKGHCYRGFFNGCTGLLEAPELPATSLSSNCYAYMFRMCTSLTTAPVLKATRLTTNCYSNMFYGCSSLNYIKSMNTTDPNSYCGNWVYGVAASGTFVKNSAATWTTTGNNGIPTGWTVQTASS